MKRMHIQLQPSRSPKLDVEATVARLQSLATAMVTRGDDGGPYVNVDFSPTDVRTLWAAVREQFENNPALAACAIICCEGSQGWDDYRQLHHYDPAEPLDELT